MPAWFDLTLRVFNRATRQTLTKFAFRRLANHTGFSLDAWLQAGLNTMIVAEEEREHFIELIEDELYRDLLSKADVHGQREFLIKGLSKPKMLKTQTQASLALLKFFEIEFGRSSLLALARSLRKAKRSKVPPSAVLTFNADGLLDLLLNLLAIKERDDHQKLRAVPMPKDEFRRVLRASDDRRHVVPIYHLHGCIVPRTNNPSFRYESRDELVFPESGYSRISSTVFTWQQTVFLSHAQSQRLVFIGLSMTDPNLRRWLSWCTANSVQEQRQREREQRQKATRDRGEYILGQHLWLAKRPRELAHQAALESSLLHLGTRIAWLDAWSQLPEALANLLNEGYSQAP